MILLLLCILFVLPGESHAQLPTVDSLINQAIQDSVFPGAVLMIGEKAEILYARAYGHHDYSDQARPTQVSNIFDLASLTKVFATTLAIMRLYEQDMIDLQAPVTDYIPEFGQNNKGSISVWNLLVHNSGFPPGKPFYRTCDNKQQVLDSLYAMPLRYPTGTKVVYSDLGFITLGRIVEICTGRSLDQYVAEEFYQPMHMSSTTFDPPDDFWQRIVPSEPEFNYRLTQTPGTPKNKITQTMGNVAGHAGLFSNAPDLSRCVRMLMHGGQYQGKHYFKAATIDFFTTPQIEGHSRGLGWDTGQGGGKYHIGQEFSDGAFGHTGFTGTSVWIDPDKDIFVILLSNRTYQMTDRKAMYRFRPVVHNEIMRYYDRLKH